MRWMKKPVALVAGHLVCVNLIRDYEQQRCIRANLEECVTQESGIKIVVVAVVVNSTQV